MTKEVALGSDYKEFISELKSRVQSAQIKAALKVNEELISLYWEIGKEIVKKQKTSGWGDGIIDQIAKDLTGELGGLKGFSRANLYKMKQFYVFHFDQGEFVSQLVRQIPWGHNTHIIHKVKNKEQALWYVQKTIENDWSRNILAMQIDSQLYQRQAERPKIDNFNDKLPAPDSDLFRETLKDPYVFDFLSVGDDAHEREIEKLLVKHITDFLLELGRGFAFVGHQFQVDVGGDEFFIDLLMYNYKLHRFVVIELKNGSFKPADAGQLNFYLTAVDEQVKTDLDNPSIGMILCRDKNNLVAEYALRGMSQPMGISEFELTKQLPDELKGSLPTIKELEAELEEIKQLGDDSADG